MELQTTTGEGCAIVTVEYRMTQDSNEAYTSTPGARWFQALSAGAVCGGVTQQE